MKVKNMDKILVLNSGSTSVKFQLFNVDDNNFDVITKGLVDRVGLDGSKIIVKADNEHDFTMETPINNIIIIFISTCFLVSTSVLSVVFVFLVFFLIFLLL